MRRTVSNNHWSTILPCLACVLAWPAGASAQGQAEASSQAAEADRLFKQGDFAAALPLYEAERTSRAKLGDLRYEAYALRAMGICHAEMGDDVRAIEPLRQALTLDEKRDDRGYAGYDQFLIAQAESRLGRPFDAIKTLEAAIPNLSTAVDRDHEADAQLSIARLLVDVGRADEARTHADRARSLADELKDAWRQADAVASAGQIEGALRRPGPALERFDDAKARFEGQGRAADAAWMETLAASALVLLGRDDDALKRYREAAGLHHHLEDGGSEAEDLTNIAGLDLKAGRLAEALRSAELAVDRSRDADDREREVEARVRLAEVFGAQGKWPEASGVLDEAVDLIRQVARDDPAEQLRVLLTAAEVDRRASLPDRASKRFDAAEAIASDSKSPELIAFVAKMRTKGAASGPDPSATPPPRPGPR